MRKTSIKGQSLFEIVFAIGIAALVLVGVVSIATLSIRNTEFSQNKTRATKFSQEAIEWLRQQRDLDWVEFSKKSSEVGETIYLGELYWDTPAPSAIPDTPFERKVFLQTDSANPSQIKATIEVSWTDGQGVHSVDSVTIYTDWTTRL